MQEVALVGSPFPPDEFTRFLEEQDPCFGKHFAKTAPECQRCLAPIIVQGRLSFVRDLCEAQCKGAESPQLLRDLTTQDIIQRLEQGKSVEEIFVEVLGDADPKLAADAARQLLYRRFYYMRKTLDLPTPELPPMKELRSHVRD